jgi:hypothetical protein
MAYIESVECISADPKIGSLGYYITGVIPDL